MISTLDQHCFLLASTANLESRHEVPRVGPRGYSRTGTITRGPRTQLHHPWNQTLSPLCFYVDTCISSSAPNPSHNFLQTPRTWTRTKTLLSWFIQTTPSHVMISGWRAAPSNRRRAPTRLLCSAPSFPLPSHSHALAPIGPGLRLEPWALRASIGTRIPLSP